MRDFDVDAKLVTWDALRELQHYIFITKDCHIQLIIGYIILIVSFEFSTEYFDIFKTALEAYTAWKLFVFGIFLLRIFPQSDRIRRDTPYLSVFNPNSGK